MKEIHIADIISSKRKEKGITQDELASYMGVSKAAISKWETGQSYPDIVLLPILASYFNISIDTLMGYSPQLCSEDIRKLYRQLCDEFSKLPFEEVIDHVHSIIHKYPSCFEVLHQMVLILINHSMLSKQVERSHELYREALSLCKRIHKESEDLSLQKKAFNLEIYCYLVLQEPKEALAIMSKIEPLESNSLLANAYLQDHQETKALQCMQVDIYQCIMILFNSYSLLLNHSIDKEENFTYHYDCIHKIERIYDVLHLNPGIVLPIYIMGMQGYTQFGNHKKALEIMRQYCDALMYSIKSFKPTAHQHFHLVDEWLKEEGGGDIESPRNNEIILKSALSIFEQNPILEPLANTDEFKKLYEKLKKYIQEEQ